MYCLTCVQVVSLEKDGEPSPIMATLLKMATSTVYNMYCLTCVQVVSLEKDGEPSPIMATFPKMATSTVYKMAGLGSFQSSQAYKVRTMIKSKKIHGRISGEKSSSLYRNHETVKSNKKVDGCQEKRTKCRVTPQILVNPFLRKKQTFTKRYSPLPEIYAQ